MSTPIDTNVYQPRHTTLTKITAVPLTANKAGFRLALNADGTDFVWVAPDTNQVPEGGNNLYFTTARARAAINGAASTVLTANLPLSRVLISNSTGKIVSSAITAIELGYLGGVTTAIQPQLTALTTTINNLVAFPRTLATITGAVSNITTINLPASKVLVSDTNGKVVAGNVTSAEVEHLSGVTANVQTQLSVLNNRMGALDTTAVVEGTNQYFTTARAVAVITGAASTITSTDLSPGRALVSDANGKVKVSDVSISELGHLSGTTSNLQTQLLILNNRVDELDVVDTNSIEEGTNLYFTPARAIAAITGAASTIATTNLTASRVLSSDATGKVVASTVTTTELGYLAGATSNLQTQVTGLSTTINGLTTTSITEGTNQYFTPAKAVAAITGAASSIATTNLLTTRALVSDGTGKVSISAVTTTELGYLAGTTSAIQTQINTLTGRSIIVGSGMTGGGSLSSNISIGLSFDASTSNIKMDGAVSLGTLNTVPRADHVHPSDTTKISASTMGVASGVATLDTNAKIPTAQIPAITTTVGFGGEVISVPYSGTTITLPLPVNQGGTGTTTSTGALSALGGQPLSPTLTTISSVTTAGILVKDASGLAQVRSIQVNNPLTITNPSGIAGNPTVSLSQGHGTGLDADLLDGAHGSSYFKVDGTVSYSTGTASTIRNSISAASKGVNTDITSLAAVTGLGNGSTSHIVITNTGNVLVGTNVATANGGDVQISKGVTFPSVQVPCSNVNTLDDYKEGTWTPSLDSITPGTGRVTNIRSALFTKIGNLVTFTTFVDMSTLGTGGSGALVINGLPYTATNAASAQVYCAVSVPYFNGLKSALVSLGGTVQPNTSYILFRGWAAAVNNVLSLDFNTHVQAGSAFIVTGFYYTA